MNEATEIFEFREFRMEQGPSGQRINTDSCVFGDVFCSHDRESFQVRGKVDDFHILDIGTGSGVLALMAAAAFPTAKITGLEVEPELAGLAARNFAGSPWHGRLRAIHVAVQDFCAQPRQHFDFIVCNPPFFRHSTKSKNPARSIARHDHALEAVDLAASCKKILSTDGHVWILVAGGDETRWLGAFAGQGFRPAVRVELADNPAATHHAVIIQFQKKNSGGATSTARIDFKSAPGGPRSAWMQSHRERWFPIRYQRIQTGRWLR